jgi:hypothetical protein
MRFFHVFLMAIPLIALGPTLAFAYSNDGRSSASAYYSGCDCHFGYGSDGCTVAVACGSEGGRCARACELPRHAENSSPRE